MDATGGSYMQQPNTSSEAVKRCMALPNAPLSSQVRVFHRPHPPYANGHRPTSAPVRRTTYAYHNQNDPPRNPSALHNRYVHDTSISRNAPYAARTAQGHVNSSLGYPVVDSGRQSVPIPDYSSFNDPHLLDYYNRKFTSLEYETMASMSRRYSVDSRTGLLRRKKYQHATFEHEVLYKVAITTADKKNAGTDAKVYFSMKGSKGKLPKTRMMKKAGSVKSNKDVAFRFAKGSTHIFKIKALDVGNVKSIILEQTGVKKSDSWFVQEVEVVNTKTKKTWTFICNQWLSLHHGDGLQSREFFPKQSSKTEYEVVVVTGDRMNAGTKANVFMTLFGKTAVTNKIHLDNNTKSIFDRGASDVFKIHANCVGPMTKLRLEHDNTGIGSGWYVERVVVTDMRNSRWKYFFPCGQWLAKDEGDHSICRDLVGSRDPLAIRKGAKYKVTVFTGNCRGAGTDAKVYIIMFGENGESGERFLHSSKTTFQRGKTDEFIIECPRLGRLERLRVGHNNSGFGPGWFLDKIIIDDMQMGTVYEFPCERWLAEDEDDGHIARELLVNVGPMDAAPGIPYIITVATGDKQNAGTDANVFVELIGSGKGHDTSGKIWLENGSFERGKADIFNVDVGKMLSPLSRVDIGHDNSGVASGWLLDSVTVYCPSAGIEQFFPHGKWLATDEGDQVVQTSLYEQKAMRKKKEKKSTWCVWVFTSDVSGAGTDANVQIVVYGEKGKSDDIPLDNKGDPFEQDHMDKFKVNMTEIGRPYKLRVWHDSKGMMSGWHLDKIQMENMATKERFTFPCKRWLAVSEDDHETVRELPAEGPGIKKPLPVVHYTVEVHTGKKTFAGTNANVYINIFGELGDTGHRFLKKSENNKDKFEKGKVDVFSVEAVTLMKLNKIVIGHDGKGAGSGWFLDKVIVKQDGNHKYDATFECNRWLSENDDDGLIERELMADGLAMLNTTAYHIHVKTGDVRNAGTDANVYLKIFGSKGDTGLIQLKQSGASKNKFERNRTDVFKKDASDIGQIKRIRVGHDGSRPGAGWFLDSIDIDIPSRGLHYHFAAHRWLAKDENDKQIEIELEPSVKEDREKVIPYEVTVWTGNKTLAGTDANVFIQMYGEKNKKTEELSLRNKTDNFEQGQTDKFKIEAADVGRLKKLRVGHDGTGKMSGWYLEKILIQRNAIPGTKRHRQHSLSATERRQSVLTAYRSERDDDESDSSPLSSRRKRKSLRSSQDRIDELDEEPHDGTETEDYWFFVERWFSKGEDDCAIVREFVPMDKHGRLLEGTLEEVEYDIKVYTGDVNWGGTDANVFVTLHGEKGDSGERHLDKSQNFNKFEKNQEDVFSVKAVDLGALTKLRIRHDNKLGGADWFLDRVEVEDKKRKKHYFFPCQRWLATGKDDGQIARDLVPVDPLLKKKLTRKDSTAIRDEIALEMKAALTTYHVKVTTGKDWGASTDANVYIDLYGDINNTNKMFLKSSLTNKNKFQRGKMDEFVLEVAQIGDLKKIKVGHDNAGGGAAWQLDNIVIDAPSLGKTWKFPCGRWLGLKEDDGLLERELFPQELATEDYIPCIPYEITTYTSDVNGAGTNADVFVILYGKDAYTEAKSLCPNKQERKDRFERKSVDKFVVEMEDVGDTIEKLRIGHDGSGFGAGWHLNKVEVRKLHESGKGSTTYVFPCDRWLAKGEDDNSIVRELLPEKAMKEIISTSGEVKKRDVKIKDKLSVKKYIINVITGNVSGASTDANVFLTIFGNKGDTGERQLSKSDTYKDKFEKGHTDIFNIEAVDLGEIYKIKIRHDNALISPAWYLDRVEIEDPASRKKFVFHCERWLAKNKEDGKLERSLYVKGYDGDMSSTGTLRSTRFGSMSSIDSQQSFDPFSKSPRMKRASMSLERVPEGPTIPYTIKLSTGDGEDNGTDSNVWIKIMGPKKVHTGKIFLELAQKEKFLPGSIECFSIEALDVVEVKKVEIGHDGTAPGTGWFVKEIEVDLPTKGKHYQFKCEQWLARDKSDGLTSRVFNVDDGLSSITSFTPLIPYEVTVYTGDVPEGGTDSKITITVFGSTGTTTPTELPKTEERFERAKINTLRMELDDVGQIKKIRVAIDGKGSRSSWYLDKMELRNMTTGAVSSFHYTNWLGKDKGQGDGRLSVDLPAMVRGKAAISKTTYKVTVKTSDVRGAGTDANVYIIIFGRNGDSGEIHLKKSETNKNPFQGNQTDIFTLEGLLSLGELSKLRIWHDNKGMGAAWYLTSVEVEDLDKKKTYTFICDKWLSKSEGDKQILRELTCVGPVKPDSFGSKENIVYEIEVSTTDKKDGGTMHNAWLILEGSRRSSKLFKMENSSHNKILRRGQVDAFKLMSPPLGKLERCILGSFERDEIPHHDMQGREAEWHCHNIVVTDTIGGEKYTFECKSWIPVDPRISKQDGKVLKVKDVEASHVAAVRNLAPIQYDVLFYTGDLKSAGTSANVAITIYGQNGDTGKRILNRNWRSFGKNEKDRFQLEALDLGELTKVVVEHDNDGLRPAWYLDHMEVVNMATNKTTNFSCNKWLDKERGLSHDLYPDNT